MAKEYEEQVGTLVSGQVKQVTRHAIYVELSDQVEAVLSRSQLLPREIYRVGDAVVAYLFEVDPQAKGPMLQLVEFILTW